MRLTEKFIDCVYESDLHGKDMTKFKIELVNKLPDKRIADLANVLIIDTGDGLYAVKIRMIELKPDGTIDVEKIHNTIMNSNFIEIVGGDIRSVSDCEKLVFSLNILLPSDINIIFRMKNVDVNKFGFFDKAIKKTNINISSMKFRGLTTKKEDHIREFNETWVEGDLIHSGGKVYIHPTANVVSVNHELGRLIVMHEVQPETVTLIN